jgi:hypothetical protein
MIEKPDSTLEPLSSNERMEESIIVALAWALGLENDDEQQETIGEIFSYAAIEGDFGSDQLMNY